MNGSEGIVMTCWRIRIVPITISGSVVCAATVSTSNRIYKLIAERRSAMSIALKYGCRIS